MKKPPHHFFAMLAVLFLLVGCSPYQEQMQRLDKAYAAGQMDAKTYWTIRQQLMQGDMQWRQQVAINAGAINAGLLAARPVYVAPPPAPQFMPVGHYYSNPVPSIPPPQNFNATVTGPGGTSFINGTTY